MSAQIISFHCILKNKAGKVLSSTFNNDVLTATGAPTDMLKGLAHGLQDLKKGEKRRISLSAEEAYGFYDPDKLQIVYRDDLPNGENIRCGDQVLIKSNEKKDRQVYRVAQIQGELVTLDANHPLAGQDLVFEIEAVAARAATPEEISETFAETDEGPRYH